MRKSVSMFCLVVTALAASTVPAQQFYKWKDASGATHYSEKPPETGKAQIVTLTSDGSAPPNASDPVAVAKAAQADQEEANHRAAACINARKNLGSLTQGDLQDRPGATAGDAESNSTLRLSPSQREAAEQNAERQIQQLCD